MRLVSPVACLPRVHARVHALACALGLLALACDSPAPTAASYPVTLRTLSEDGEPLADVELVARGQRVGRTGAEGKLLVQLPGHEGAQIAFEARCPSGSQLQGEARAIRLRTLDDGPPPEVEFVCARDKRTAALIVSAPGFAQLPVLLHDREVARTDATGTAHLLLEGQPATPLRVVLDTSARPRVLPASPHKDLQITARDEVVIFAPELSEVAEPKKKVHRAKKAPPPVHIRPEKLR